MRESDPESRSTRRHADISILIQLMFYRLQKNQYLVEVEQFARSMDDDEARQNRITSRHRACRIIHASSSRETDDTRWIGYQWKSIVRVLTSTRTCVERLCGILFRDYRWKWSNTQRDLVSDYKLREFRHVYLSSVFSYLHMRNMISCIKIEYIIKQVPNVEFLLDI